MEYFTKIEDPKKLRISLMTAARDSIIVLSMLDSFTEIREQKTELMADLKDDFKEMSILCKQLSEMVSDEKTRKDILENAKNLRIKEEPPKSYSKPGQKEVFKHTPFYPQTKTPEVKSKTEVDRLEYTLSQIEQKLADLNK